MWRSTAWWAPCRWPATFLTSCGAPTSAMFACCASIWRARARTGQELSRESRVGWADAAKACPMLPILGYLAAVGALFVGAALGLMVLLGESAGIGKNVAAYADAKAAATAKPMGLAGAGVGA